MPFCAEFIRNGLKLPKTPALCKELTIDYLARSDNIYEWVRAKFSAGSDTDFIYIDDMYNIFKSSDYFENMSKTDKRNFNMKNFSENIQRNHFLKENFRSRDAVIGEYRIKQSAIIGFKLM